MNDILTMFNITLIKNENGIGVNGWNNLANASPLDRHRVFHAIEDFILNDSETTDEQKDIAVFNLISTRAETLDIIPNPMEMLMGMFGGNDR